MIFSRRIRKAASPILVLAGILGALSSSCCCAAKAGTDHAGMSARVGMISGSACFASGAAAARAAGRAIRKEAGAVAVERRGRRVAVARNGAAAGQEPRKPLAMALASQKGSGRWCGGLGFGGISAGKLGLLDAVKQAAAQVGGIARRAATTSSLQIDEGEAVKEQTGASAAPKAKRARRSKTAADADAPGGEEGGQGGGEVAGAASPSPSASATKTRKRRVATKQGDEQAEEPRAAKAAPLAKKAAAAKLKPRAAGGASRSTVFPLPEVVAGEADEAKGETKRRKPAAATTATGSKGSKFAGGVGSSAAQVRDGSGGDVVGQAAVVDDDGDVLTSKVQMKGKASGVKDGNGHAADGAKGSKAGGDASRLVQYPELVVYIDGACRGNPGQASYGVAIKDPRGAKVYNIARRIGHKTNNEAEWEGAIEGLRMARELGASKVTIRTDSQLVSRQFSGQYKVSKPHLAVLHKKAVALKAEFGDCSMEWVPREQNKDADALANYALDSGDRQWDFSA
jgi:ribonuclease HI